MSVRIRFKREGRPHAGYFQIVAIDRQKARDDKPIEVLGTINPRLKSKVEAIKTERIKYWLSVGAKPTDTIVHALKVNGLWSQVQPVSSPKT